VQKSDHFAPFEEQVEALKELNSKAASLNIGAIKKLNIVTACLFNPEYSDAEHRKTMRRSKHLPRAVQNGLNLYRKMNQVMALCEPRREPRCSVVGSACFVALIPFATLDYDGFLDLRQNFMFMLDRLPKSRSKFRGLDLLSPDERRRYEVLSGKDHTGKGIYFGGRKKHTLKSLAVCLLEEEERLSYSESTVRRAIDEINKYKFEDVNWKRDSMIRAVNGFGKSTRTVGEFSADAQKHFVRALRMTDFSAQILTHQYFADLRESVAVVSAREIAPIVAQKSQEIASVAAKVMASIIEYSKHQSKRVSIN